MKEIKENGIVKSTKPYKMKFFKKVLSAISIAAVAATLFVGVVFTMTACGPSEPAPEPPPIVQPIDPDPDDPDQPVDPDPDDPDQPVDPDPDDPDQPVDPDPDDPDPDDPDQPVDPDPDDPDQPDNPDNPPPEPEVPTTLEELMQEGNEEYQAMVAATLNDNLYKDMLYKTVGTNYDLSKVEDEKWEIVDSNNDGIIDNIRLHFFYKDSDTLKTYRISNVEPKLDITLADLLTEGPDIDNLDEAFDTAIRGGAKYSTDYTFSYNSTIQESRKELKDAVNTKLAADGIISAVDKNTKSFIKDNGSSVNTTLGGTARDIVVMNLTENGYEEINIKIKETQNDNTDKTLKDNLKDGLYYEVESAAKNGKFIGTVLENVDLPEKETVTATRYKIVYTNDKGETEEYNLDY